MDFLHLALAVILVAANAFFVAAEFALVTVRRTRLEQLINEGRAFALSARWLRSRLDRALSACQLGITIASLGLGWVGEPAVAHLLEPLLRSAGVTSPRVLQGTAIAVGFTLITAIHLVIGEQAPKILAIRRPENLATWCALPLKTFYIVSFPLLRLLDATTGVILRALGVDGADEHEVPHDPEELRHLVGRSRTHGHLTRTEHRLVEAALDFDDTICRQIMVPRPEIVFLDVKRTGDELLRIVRETRHTRYPVCRGALDNVLGIAHVKDLMGVAVPDAPNLRRVLRPPKYVPETMPIGRLLGHFQATHQHMAIVADEFGSMVGIVTMENVLEQIVGDVDDEFDDDTPDIVAEGSGSFLVQGRTSLSKVRRELNIELATEEDDEVDTLSGLLVLRLGRMAVSGDKVSLGEDVSAEVVQVERNRASLIRLTTGSEGG